MNTKNMIQEKISALVDDELADDQADQLLTALRGGTGRADWDLYHQIGDALRSDDLAFDMSPDFSARLTARLEQEPTILALTNPEMTAISPNHFFEQTRDAADHAHAPQNRRRSFGKRIFLAGSAAAAAAAIAFVVAPTLMVAFNGSGNNGNSGVMVAASKNGALLTASAVGSAASAHAGIGSVHDNEMLRDPRIDEYLAAHQRFSPSPYGTTQYARATAFVSDSEK